MEWWYFFGHVHSTDPDRPASWSIVTTLLKRRMAFGGWPTTWLAATQVVDTLRRTRICTGAIPSLSCYDAAAFRWSTPSFPRLPHWQLTRGTTDWHLAYRRRVTLDLTFDDPGPTLPVGPEGVMQYGGGHELGWYMRPSLTLTGSVSAGNGPVAVHGHGWMERQWGWSPVETFAWRYLTLRLEDGRRFLLFHSRVEGHHTTYGLRIEADGGTTPIPDLTLTPIPPSAPAGYPVTAVRGGGLDLLVSALPIDQLIQPGLPGAPEFYEGFSDVRGRVDGADVYGVGVTELRGPSRDFVRTPYV